MHCICNTLMPEVRFVTLTVDGGRATLGGRRQSMIPASALVLLLATCFAQAPARPPERPAPETETAKAAPELARLD